MSVVDACVVIPSQVQFGVTAVLFVLL